MNPATVVLCMIACFVAGCFLGGAVMFHKLKVGKPIPIGGNVFAKEPAWYRVLPEKGYRGAFGLDLAYSAKEPQPHVSPVQDPPQAEPSDSVQPRPLDDEDDEEEIESSLCPKCGHEAMSSIVRWNKETNRMDWTCSQCKADWSTPPLDAGEEVGGAT